MLTHLGYDDGDLESRLERAIAAVAAARRRQEAGSRGRAEIEQEVAALDAAAPGHRPARLGRGGRADRSAPTDPDLLEARRREMGELVAAAAGPDVVGAERRYDVSLARVNELEARLDEPGQRAGLAPAAAHLPPRPDHLGGRPRGVGAGVRRRGAEPACRPPSGWSCSTW